MKNNLRLGLWSLLLMTAAIGAAGEHAEGRALTVQAEEAQMVAASESYVLLLRTSGATMTTEKATAAGTEPQISGLRDGSGNRKIFHQLESSAKKRC